MTLVRKILTITDYNVRHKITRAAGIAIFQNPLILHSQSPPPPPHHHRPHHHGGKRLPPHLDPNHIPPHLDPNHIPPHLDPNHIPPHLDPNHIPPHLNPNHVPPHLRDPVANAANATNATNATNAATTAADLTPLYEVGYELGQDLMSRLLPLFPNGPNSVTSYGKAAMSSPELDMELCAALVHPKLGLAMRTPLGSGTVCIPSNIKSGSAGCVTNRRYRIHTDISSIIFVLTFSFFFHPAFFYVICFYFFTKFLIQNSTGRSSGSFK